MPEHTIWGDWLMFGLLAKVPLAKVLTLWMPFVFPGTMPGQAIAVTCTTPSGQVNTFAAMGDGPEIQLSLTALDCSMPPDYLKSLW